MRYLSMSGIAAAATAVLLSQPAQAQTQGQSQSQSQSQYNFSYTGAAEAFIVPPGVTSIHVDLWGAAGGGASNHFLSVPGRGGGGWALADLQVTPGEQLTLLVGGAGKTGWILASGEAGTPPDFGGGGGGFNGGGNGNMGHSGSFQFLYAGGGGGGATTLLRGSTRLMVAGGGGRDSIRGGDFAGGGGGGLSGLAGQGTGGGAGGTQTTGGSQGLGGNAVGRAGGGDGGYFGGRGGNNAAGGGSSSFVGGLGLTAGDTLSNYNLGDGRARFTFSVSVVPEPATWLLMVAGVGVLMQRRRGARRAPARAPRASSPATARWPRACPLSAAGAVRKGRGTPRRRVGGPAT